MKTLKLPLWPKLLFTAFVLVWVPVYWLEYGPANFLWLCDLANLLLLAALWWENALLFSSQAVGVLVLQVLWCVDYFGRLVLGFHPIGGTQYMWSEDIPLPIRALSLFHLVVPPLLVWGVLRLGYDRRGVWLQTAIAWAVLPVAFFFTDPVRNLNWLWRPFEREQTLLPPVGLFALMLVIYPLVIYLPSHLLLELTVGRRQRRLGALEEKAPA